MKSKSLLFQVCLFAMMALLPTISRAQFIYSTNNGTITITKYFGSTTAPIPATFTGLPVTTIGAYAFAGTSYAGGTIPGNITSIGAYAFANCTKLPFVSMANSVTNIGDHAFDGCIALSSLTLSTNITSIGAYLVAGCTKLTSISIPNSVTNFGAYSFSGCYNLATVAFANPALSSLASIDEGAFNGCSSLTLNGSFEMPNSVITLGDYAFNGCHNLVMYNNSALSTNLTSIGAYAFADCTRITYILIPNSVTNIGAFAFNNSYNFDTITFSDTTHSRLASIGEGAFNGCRGLSGFTIPANVTSIGAYAFSGCNNLGGIAVNGANTAYTSVNGVLFDKNETTLIQYPAGLAFFSYNLPASVISIAEGAFIPSVNLTAITVSAGNPAFTSVGGVLFSKDQTTLIQYPAGLRSPAYTVTNTVTGIADNAFNGCYGLTALYFQGNAPALGSNVFSDFNSTAVVYYLPGTIGWGATYGGLPAMPLNPGTQSVGINNATVQNGKFGFTITGTNNEVVVVDASTNLAQPNWHPVLTNTLNSTTFNFSDPEWTNYPSLFYRVRPGP